MGERFVIERDGCDLAGERWPGDGQVVVLLHEGVADRRGWRQVAQRLAPRVTVVAYDRRGYGESAVSTSPFTHVGDLLAVLDREGPGGRGWPAPQPAAAWRWMPRCSRRTGSRAWC